MPVDMLKSPPQAPDATVDGVTYKIKSEAKWITDDVGGAPACGVGSAENQVEYLHIMTTVTSKVVGAANPGGHRRLARRADHEVGRGPRHARRQGRRPHRRRRRQHHGHADLARVLADRTGDQRPGLRLWKSVPVGSYTITLNTPGYIDTKGNQLSRTVQNVVAKKVSFPTIRYDRPARANVSVTTHTPGTNWSVADAKTSKVFDVSATNGAEVGFFRTFTPASATNAFQVSQLFPFATNSYSFFSGRCGWADPEDYNSNYFSATNPGAGLLADPNLVKDVAVRQPPFNIRVTRRYAVDHVHRRAGHGVRAPAAAGGVHRGVRPAGVPAHDQGVAAAARGARAPTPRTGCRRKARPSIPACRSATTSSAWCTAPRGSLVTEHLQQHDAQRLRGEPPSTTPSSSISRTRRGARPRGAGSDARPHPPRGRHDAPRGSRHAHDRDGHHAGDVLARGGHDGPLRRGRRARRRGPARAFRDG